MPRYYYVLPDDQNRWFVSESPDATAAARTCGTRSEALDHLGGELERQGLTMSKPLPLQNNGFRVEAIEATGLNFKDNAVAFVYSSEALRAITFLQDKLDEILTRAAQGIAMSQGRTRVTADDIFAALDELGLSKIDPESSEGTEDGG